MEFFSPLNQALLASGAARVSVFKPPDPSRVNGGNEATRTETSPQDTGHNAANADQKRIADRLKQTDRLTDAERPAGPPPSFEVSVLEQELDFKRTMARLEAAHSQARDIEAVRPDPVSKDAGGKEAAPAPGSNGPNLATSAEAGATPARPDTLTPPFLFGSQ